MAEILNYFLELLFSNSWREILNDFIRVQGTTECSALYRIDKALPIFSPSVCMDHTPCKLEIKGEQSIHSIPSFVHQSNSILSFFQISKDAHMVQKQPKNGTEKGESYSLQQNNGSS